MNIKQGILSIFDVIKGRIQPEIILEKGLYTYKVEQTDGKSIHIQLRVTEDKNGILFIDLTDVLHLNWSATLIFKMILDKKSRHFAYTYIENNFNIEYFDSLREEIYLISDFCDHLKSGHQDCFICNYVEKFSKRPLFSEKVTAPYKVDLALTYGCNNGCSHCYNEKKRLPMPSLRKNDWFKIIDKLVGEGIPHLILTGGEATLHPDLPDIIRYSENLGMVVGLNTNGRRLADKNYLYLLRDFGLNHVQFTLGSQKPEYHNTMMNAVSFEQTVLGINNAVESGVHVITNTTIIQKNKNELSELIHFLYELGIRTFAMNGLIYSGGGTEMGESIPEVEMQIILDQVKTIAIELGMKFLWYSPTEYCQINPTQLDVGIKRCNAGEYSICIEPNGNILPCQSYYFASGNLLTDNWDDIWNFQLNRSFRTRKQDASGVFLPDYCRECPTMGVCGGGCKIERDSISGNNNSDSLKIELLDPSKFDQERFYPTDGMIRSERAEGVDKRKY